MVESPFLRPASRILQRDIHLEQTNSFLRVLYISNLFLRKATCDCRKITKESPYLRMHQRFSTPLLFFQISSHSSEETKMVFAKEDLRYQILALGRIIEKLKVSGKKASIVFVDFCKAFNSVNRNAMLCIHALTTECDRRQLMLSQ